MKRRKKDRWSEKEKIGGVGEHEAIWSGKESKDGVGRRGADRWSGRR